MVNSDKTLKKNIKKNNISSIMSKLQNVNKLDLNLPTKQIYFAKTTSLKRIFAFFIDLLIFDFLISPLRVVFENYNSFTLVQQNYSLLSGFLILIGLLFFLYNYVFQINFQQTPGMMIVGIFLINSRKIKSVKTDNKNSYDASIFDLIPDKIQILLRNIVFIPIFPMILFWLIDPIYLIFKNERLVDKWFEVKTVEKISM